MGRFSSFTSLGIEFLGFFCSFFSGFTVQELASTTVGAVQILVEALALLGLVIFVKIDLLLELVASVSE